MDSIFAGCWSRASLDASETFGGSLMACPVRWSKESGGLKTVSPQGIDPAEGFPFGGTIKTSLTAFESLACD
jgi:hypothetical protein